MMLRKIAETCEDGACPTVFINERGNVVVQGYVASSDGMRLAGNEQVVEVPADLIRRAAKALAT